MAITIPVPQVSTSALPLVQERMNHTADESGYSVGANLAQGATQVLSAVEKYQKKAKAEADDLAVEEAMNRTRQQNIAALESVKQAEGRNAAEVAQKVYEDSDKFTKDQFSGLQNDEQKRLYTEKANNALLQLRAVSESHVGQQIKVAEEREDRFAQAASLDSAARHGDVTQDVNGVPTKIVDVEAQSARERATKRADRLGLRGPAAQEYVNQQVGQVQLAYAHAIAGESRYEEAATFLRAHATETGVDGAALLGKVEHELRQAKADDKARDILKAAGTNELGAANIADARDAVDKIPAGPEREAVAKALEVRWQHAEDSRMAGRAVRLEKVRDFILAQSNDPGKRSIAALRATKTGNSAWLALDADQQIGVENMIQADQNAAKHAEMTPGQIKGYVDLALDIDRNPAKYSQGTSALYEDKRFTNLPEARRLDLAGKAIQANHEREAAREAGVQPVKPNEVAIAFAQKNGIISAEKQEKWSPDDHLKALGVQDLVSRKTADWKQKPENKGKVAPSPEEVKTWVREGYRQGEIAGTGTFSNDKMTEAEAKRRPATLQQTQSFVPKLDDEESKKGEELLKRQGLDPQRDQNSFTPQKKREIARRWAELQDGPGPMDRERIVKRLKERRGYRDDQITPELLQDLYEREQLKLIR